MTSLSEIEVKNPKVGRFGNVAYSFIEEVSGTCIILTDESFDVNLEDSMEISPVNESTIRFERTLTLEEIEQIKRELIAPNYNNFKKCHSEIFKFRYSELKNRDGQKPL
jgi:hypothetical protein